MNPKCSAYYDYFSHRQTRMNFPTEQISFQSNIIPALQMSGKFSYTGGDMNVNNYQQSFAGLESRSQLTNFLQNGPIEGRHVASYGDFGATWKISPMLSVVDSFDYSNWMEPGQFVSSECSFFSTNLIVPPNIFAPTASLPFAPCVAPPNGVAGTPSHTSSSGPDMLINLDSNFLKQRIYTNLIEAQVELPQKPERTSGIATETERSPTISITRKTPSIFRIIPPAAIAPASTARCLSHNPIFRMAAP